MTYGDASILSNAFFTEFYKSINGINKKHNKEGKGWLALSWLKWKLSLMLEIKLKTGHYWSSSS